MSLTPIRVEIDQTLGEQRIGRIAGRFARMEDVLQGDAVRALIGDAMRQQFATRGRWGGTPWARLKSSTVRRKRLEGTYGKGALRRTDRLYRAATEPGDAPHSRLRLFKNKVRFDITLRYAAAHQRGTKRMPARQIIPEQMPPEFIGKLRNIVRGYLIEGRLGR